MEGLLAERVGLRCLVAAFDRLAAAHLESLLRDDAPEADIVAVHSPAELDMAIGDPFDLVVLDTRNMDNPAALVESLKPLADTGCRIAAIVIDEMPEHLRWATHTMKTWGLPHGLLPATMTPTQCKAALVRVATGHEYVNWALRGAGCQTVIEGWPAPETSIPAGPDLLDLLTPRELEILPLLKQGLRNKEVAERLAISVNTAKIHIASIKRKYRVSSRMQLL